MVNQKINMSEVQNKGILLGELSPTKESKGAWSELYYFNNKLISIIYSDTQDCWAVDAEFVQNDKIPLYVDEPERAKYLLKQHIIKNSIKL